MDEQEPPTPPAEAPEKPATSRRRRKVRTSRRPDNVDNVPTTVPLTGTTAATKPASTASASVDSLMSTDSAPLTLKTARGRNPRVAGILAACARPQRRGGMRALLERMRERHHAYAAMHTAAGRSAARYHRNFTVAILAITLITTLVINVMQELAPAMWTTLVSNAALALIAGLTAINNFLGYQKREEQHRNAKVSHLRAAGLIDIAIACDEEDPSVTYDYTSVLEEIQEIHDNLKKTTVEIPSWVAEKYPEYEAPWLLRDDGSSSSDEEVRVAINQV